ncbi:MAG: response regulator [Anaerolineae bacterium]|jgi:DNA-binding NarL/FixJ family response regulator
MPNKDTIRILVVNQVHLVDHLLTALLAGEPDIEVVASVTSLDGAFDLARRSDLILVNTQMADGAALQLVRRLASAELPAKVLVLGLVEAQEQLLPYLRAGAVGYVRNDDSVDALLRKIRDACSPKE